MAALTGRCYSTIRDRGKAPKPKKRTRKEQARIYGTLEHIHWLKAHRCCVCGWRAPSEIAHTRNGGTGRKANWEHTIPLCPPHPELPVKLFDVWKARPIMRGCHREFDENKQSFRAEHDTDVLAARYAAAWLAYSGTGGAV